MAATYPGFFLLGTTARARVAAARGGNSPETSSERDAVMGIDRALAREIRDAKGRLTTVLDRTDGEQGARATSNGVCGLVLRGERVPEGEVDGTEACEHLGD